MAKCKGCGREIKWIETRNRPMPCDTELKTIVTENGDVFRGYTPHWATCPKAQQFKRKGDAINGGRDR